ncbi:MAG: DMT family transporter [Casimicrobiaceae bacterium]
MPTRTFAPTVFPALAALANASVWGASWIALKWLSAHAVGALWVTLVAFALCTLAIVIASPRAFGMLARHRALGWIALAAGVTNVCFSVALATGDVVRSVLLFYLMPAWVVLLARWLLNETITRAALGRLILAIAGAVLVLGDGQWIAPWPTSAADGLAIAGGFAFGLNNVLLRKHRDTPAEARALAMFGGAVLLAPIAIVLVRLIIGPIEATRFEPDTGAFLVLAGFALAVLFANLALQYGAARLPANVLSLIMLSEILVASLTAWVLGASTLGRGTLAGGALIVAATLFALFARRPGAR